MSKNSTELKKRTKAAPKRPGVYIFKSPKNKYLYIGKATNLRNRVQQYFKYNAAAVYLKHLLNEAEKIEYRTTDSEIEALLLESRLIKELQPKYNIMLRDDKQYFYVGFTNENFSKIFITHQPTKTVISNKLYVISQKIKPKTYNPEGVRQTGPYGAGLKLKTKFIGPFTDGTAIKTTLRLLRRIFPYCTCKQKHNNFCLNYHIGKCMGFCCIKNPELGIMNHESGKYKRNIRAIRNILTGKKESLISKLKKDLKKLGKEGKFEEAIELRNKIEKLERVFTNAKIIHDPYSIIHTSENLEEKKNVLKKLKQVFKLPHIPKRIEGYDVSNIQGTNATGAMVVFSDGKPDKKEYRKFRLGTIRKPDLSAEARRAKTDDIAMLKEVLTRRFNHPEWPAPDLIFIDGGKAQLNIAKNIPNSLNLNIPVIGLAKGKTEVFSTTKEKAVPLAQLPLEVQNLIKQIDGEAHRFAVSYYRKLHRKKLIPKFTP